MNLVERAMEATDVCPRDRDREVELQPAPADVNAIAPRFHFRDFGHMQGKFAGHDFTPKARAEAESATRKIAKSHRLIKGFVTPADPLFSQLAPALHPWADATGRGGTAKISRARISVMAVAR
jgi:hypothetical protein